MPDGANLPRVRRVANPSHKLTDPDNDGEIQLKTHQIQRAEELKAQHLRVLEKEKELKDATRKRGTSAANLSLEESPADQPRKKPRNDTSAGITPEDMEDSTPQQVPHDANPAATSESRTTPTA
ncbi:hypothetical protein FPV67DRAFT_1651514, partial [Lyophyllum atratum]